MLNKKHERMVKLLDECFKYIPWGEIGESTAKEVAEQLLKNDVEPVVRCEKCGWWNEHNLACIHPKNTTQHYYGKPVPKDHYCG